MLFEFWRIGQLLTNSTIRTDRKQIPVARILRRRGIEDARQETRWRYRPREYQRLSYSLESH